ncbi:protein chibby homolog 1-like [Saccostrea cucullata]|uniref:protein chibby homolog 1-like n=1 Tax=Saccostrea cuccullata TaxID=36930 RepID=UPI002ED15FED
MPLSLFGNKFSPKKTPPRRAHSLSNLHLDATQTREEFGPEVGPVKLKLGGSEIQFENGMWMAESGPGGASHKEVMKLRKQNQLLSEENNLLKLKIDVLLDMVSCFRFIYSYCVENFKIMLIIRNINQNL